ncbi:MAG TPA: serine protease [Bacteriovoracaceae bacterium]|nr:serine protease [Bacteriovoracaceae bacterium]
MKAVLFLALMVTSTVTWALPRAPFDALAKTQLKARSLNKLSMEALAYDFEGIIKLSNCSGSLIAFSGMPVTAKAMVMTNGHCIEKPGGFLSPGEVWVNRKMSRAMKVFDRNMKLHSVQATKILYATMTNTDVAFYELSQSYQEITAKTGVTPFLLDASHPVAGLPIDIISGYWDKGYSCDIDGFVFKMKEAAWSWNDSIRYTAGCDTIGGTSGSPIIARGERRVVGVNNTSNESGEKCTMNNPCEVNEQGEIKFTKGVRYGQQTYNVYTCLTPDFKFNLTAQNCELPR